MKINNCPDHRNDPSDKFHWDNLSLSSEQTIQVNSKNYELKCHHYIGLKNAGRFS